MVQHSPMAIDMTEMYHRHRAEHRLSEPGPADALRQRIEHELGWPATVPRLGQSVEIGR